eukprot:s13367_g1.t1
MVSSGLDNLQFHPCACKRMGHRHVVMLPVEKLSLYIQSCQKGQRPSYKDLLSFVSSVQPPVEKLSLYIQSCQKGQRPSYKDLLSFVSSVQPQTLASYLSMFPNEIQHGILSKHTLADVPPGWLLMEKVFFAELKRLLPFGLPQMCRNFLVSWSHAGLEREMLFRTPVAFLAKRAVQEHKGGHGVDDGCDLKAPSASAPAALANAVDGKFFLVCAEDGAIGSGSCGHPRPRTARTRRLPSTWSNEAVALSLP